MCVCVYQQYHPYPTSRLIRNPLSAFAHNVCPLLLVLRLPLFFSPREYYFITFIASGVIVILFLIIPICLRFSRIVLTTHYINFYRVYEY